MLAACTLLVIAVVSGTLLTFLYDRTAPFPARLCMGACTGMALLAGIGFLLALWLGLRPLSITLAAIVLLLPFLLLIWGSFGEFVSYKVTLAWQRLSIAFPPTRATVAYVTFYCVMAVLLGLVFGRAAYETAGGIFTGVRNNLGDLPLHLQIISSFVQGQNIPPQDPTFAGVRFAYPFMVDFLTAMLVRAGADVISAMWMQNMLLALSLVGVLQYWTLLLTRNRLAGLIAPLLVIFSGGLGWAWLFHDLQNSDTGLFSLLEQLPNNYTIMDTGILRWGNALTTLFVPQRSILFGLPLAIVIFCEWWMAASGVPKKSAGENSQPAETRRMLAAGLFTGLLPLVHAHTFLVVMGVAACLGLLFFAHWRRWLAFFAVALAVALPQVLWLGRAGGVDAQRYLGWQLGWDHGTVNPVAFWLVNTGIFIPLLLVALLQRRPETVLPGRLLKFYAPFLLCFIIPNLVKLAPWVWDNIKVLFTWYVASTPLVALLLARGLRQKSWWRWAAGAALASMVLAGALDILRVITGVTEYLEFDAQGIAIAGVISQKAAPQAVVLHAPTYNSPVFLTGRRSLLGYPGWMWSRGLDGSERNANIQSIFAGAPDADALLRRYKVEYVLIGPAELASLKPNQEFWSRYTAVAQIGAYKLYKTDVSIERAER
jgi:hypothetical protein